jgi:fatty acid desaturase
MQYVNNQQAKPPRHRAITPYLHGMSIRFLIFLTLLAAGTLYIVLRLAAWGNMGWLTPPRAVVVAT